MSNRRRLRPGPYHVRESVAVAPGGTVTVDTEPVVEDATRPPQRTVVHEASADGATVTKPGRVLARLIRSGWSLNQNHYGADVLRAAATARAFPKGTLCMADHATDEEEQARPAGSIKNLAGVLETDARWDEAEQALMAEVRLFTPWRQPIEDMHEAIGMSIRAWVVGEHGTVDGQEGFVVSEIVEGRSVDFVTVPAAGGGIVSVLEAVGNAVSTAEARNCGHWFESRIHAGFTELADRMFGEGYLNREERITLSGAVGDALAAFAARIERDAPHLYERDPYAEPAQAVAQPAAETDPAVEGSAETGESAPASPATETAVAENVTDGAPPTAPNPPIEEEPVSGTQTGAPPVQAGTATVVDTPPANTAPPEPTPTVAPAQEAPRQDAQTVAALESVTAQLSEMQKQLAAVNARAEQRDAENRALRNTNRASEAIGVALRAESLSDVAAQIGPRVSARVLAAIPTTAEGAVDEAQLTEAITAAVTDEANYVRGLRAQALEDAGFGSPRGLGAATATEAVDDGFDAELSDFFTGTLGLSTQAAQIATKGRVS